MKSSLQLMNEANERGEFDNDSRKLSLRACLAGHHDTELNIALCEWLGWKILDQTNPTFYRIGIRYDGIQMRYTNFTRGIEALGNCWEVEERLTKQQHVTYCDQLNVLCRLQMSGPGYVPFFMSHASPRHRVIAILQTVKPEMFE